MRVAVTGASGFVGQAVTTGLLLHQHDVHAVLRSLDKTAPVLAQATQTFSIGDINVDTDWTNTLSGVHCVVHCAARAHVMETETDALAAYRTVNVAGTSRLAEQAAKMGVHRLVYLSSIKLMGTRLWRSFTCLDEPFAEDHMAFQNGRQNRLYMKYLQKPTWRW